MEAPPQKRRLPWYVRIAIGGNPLYTLYRVIIWVALLFITFKFVLLGIRVHGASMEPSFLDGQVKFINRTAYLRSTPQRGDVVAIRAPDLNAVILKRVIALPGERLTIRRGEVYINGKRLEEPYTKGAALGLRWREHEMEPHQYWLIGDNRAISADYFVFDYKIMGKILF